jgi:hypothetical protein
MPRATSSSRAAVEPALIVTVEQQLIWEHRDCLEHEQKHPRRTEVATEQHDQRATTAIGVTVMTVRRAP